MVSIKSFAEILTVLPPFRLSENKPPVSEVKVPPLQESFANGTGTPVVFSVMRPFTFWATTSVVEMNRKITVRSFLMAK